MQGPESTCSVHRPPPVRFSGPEQAVETDTSTAAVLAAPWSEGAQGRNRQPGPVEASRSRADACLGQLLDNGTVNAKSQCGRCRSMTSDRILGSGSDQPSGNDQSTQFRTLTRRPALGPSRRQCASCLESAVSLEEATLRSSLSPVGVSRRWGERDLDGEFDPGSGRTLAARLTHASRT